MQKPPTSAHQSEAPAIGSRIREARIARKLTQEYVADKLRTTTQAVSNWETGKDLTHIGNFNTLSRLLGVRLQWIADGTGLRDQIEANTKVPSSGGRLVPHIDAIAAGLCGQVSNEDETGHGREFVHTEWEVSASAFALTVSGRSMEPEFHEGDIIIIDPEVTPHPGDFVVAKLDREEEATFKKYRPRGTDGNGASIMDLVPLNPDWPTLRLDASNPGHIVGVLVEHRRRFPRR